MQTRKNANLAPESFRRSTVPRRLKHRARRRRRILCLLPVILVFGVLAAALLVVFVAFLMRLLSARTARRRNARAGTTPAGEEARMLAETEELIRSIIDDLQKQ